jgi:chaperonin GroES
LVSMTPEKTFQGEVVAVGRGRLLETGEIIPLDVKVGDRIFFDKGTHCVVDGEMLVVMREEDVIAVMEQE